jgi:two-component system chemotaxis response regulator CheV
MAALSASGNKHDSSELAGSNHFEAVLFRLEAGGSLCGMNVFKTRELVNYIKATPLPGLDCAIEGVVTLRGSTFPVLNLNKAMNTPDSPATLLMVAEFGAQIIGIPVFEVMGIEQFAWADVRGGTEIMGSSAEGVIAGITHMPDGQIVALFDVESIAGRYLKLEHAPEDLAQVEKLAKPVDVLFCDDSRLARVTVQALLKQMGCVFEQCEDGEQAWARLVARAESGRLPDVLLTDIEMPHLDGYSLTKRVKADRRFDAVRVVMYSSLSSTENERMGRAAGADDYVGKFDAKLLAQALRVTA